APMAEALDDALRLGWISSLMSTHHFMMGEPDRAIACAQRALALATVCEDVTLQVDAQLHLGQAYHAVGDYRQAIAGLKQNVVCLDDILRQDQVEAVTPFGIHSLPWLIMCLAETGAFSEAMTYAEQALRIAAAGEVPYELVAVYGAVGVLHVRQGELPQARAMLERGLSLCQSAGIPHLFPTLAAHLGAVYALSGRLAEALPLLEQAVTQGAAMRLMVYHGLAVVGLSQAYLLAGRPDEARAQAWRALELCQTHQERGHQAWALQLLGDIAAHRDPPEIESAEAFYQQALSRANELGMHPLLAHCHLGLGTLYSHVEGRGEPARLELSAAIALFRSLPMPFWLPPAEAALAQVAEI
ncbi:MAG: tetratricopeptide repeat protein, partial [Candidatus Tectomicrobia bacterium]